MAPNVERPSGHIAAAAAAAVDSILPSSIFDGVTDPEAVILRVADDDSGDEIEDNSPTNEQLQSDCESTASSGGRTRNARRYLADPEADGSRVRPTKRHNRKQRVKRIAKRVNVYVVSRF
jgi:hypothetical protein